MWTTLKGLFGLVGLIKQIVTWLIAEQNKQIGRNEAAYDVTRKTAEAENRMRDIARPDGESVARSLQDRTF
jgi:hypothetical protein